MDYRISMKGAAFLRISEGWSGKYYLDNATPPVGTIGIGFTWRSAAFRVWWDRKKPGMKFGPGATMTRDEAEDALAFIMDAEYGASVENFLNATGRDYPQHQFDAAASVTYNLGAGCLEWNWADRLKANDITGAAALLKDTGTTAGGKRIKGLIARRKEEAELLLTGDYTIGGTTQVSAIADGVLQKGERGAEVEALQRDLQKLGFYDQSVDGIFGFGTQQAVIAFQTAHDLKADGFAGARTLAAISLRLVGTPMPDAPAIPQPSPAPATPKPTPATPVVKETGKTSKVGVFALILLAIVVAVLVYFKLR